MNEHEVMVNIPGGGAQHFDLTTSVFSARAGRAHVGTDAKSAPFFRLGVVRSARRRAGFTLVEVIVVLVILARLAAIAIPALTGYIAKANDKQYIAQARNASVAMKTVLNEDYAAGKLDGNTAFTLGEVSGVDNNYVYFFIPDILTTLHDDDDAFIYDYYRQAATLIGETYPADLRGSGAWRYTPLAKAGSGATAATADGFIFEFYPEGRGVDKLAIVVTYKLERIAASESAVENEVVDAIYGEGTYDPNASYEVYKLTM
jgi:prepilin-type N-terminal cleavage/methylation domain-containing protein